VVRPLRTLCRLAMLSAGVLLHHGLASQAAADEPRLAAMAHDEIAMLVFIGGGALSPDEERDAGQIVGHAMATRPAFWTDADHKARIVLQRISIGDPIARADLRERLRTAAALHPADDPDLAKEAEIIAAHDPIVVLDADHQLAVTQQTLVTWQQADQLMADRLQLAGPKQDFLTRAAAAVRASEATWDKETRDAYAHVARNLAAMRVYLAKDANSQKIAAYFAKLRTALAQGSDATQSERVAEYTAVRLLPAAYKVHEQHIARSGGGGAAGAVKLRLDAMQLRQIHHTFMCAPGDYSGFCSTLP
jgi:hypothetical protein